MRSPDPLDAFLPEYDAVQRHAIDLAASPARVWEALRSADLGRAPLVRALLAARVAPALLASRGRARGPRPGPLALDDLLGSGFVLLDERPGESITLGILG